MARDVLIKVCVVILVATVAVYPIFREDYGIQLFYLLCLAGGAMIALHLSRERFPVTQKMAPPSTPTVHLKNDTTSDNDSPPER